jgi:acetoin utilization protein AcuB
MDPTFPGRLTLNRIMTRKLVTVTMDDDLKLVRELFHAHAFHHLLVLEHHKLVGVISDRDLLRHLSPFVGKPFSERAQDEATLHKRVHQIMTRRVVTAPPDTPVLAAAELMVDQHVSCLPVVDDHLHPVGIVTWRDLLVAFVDAPSLPSPDKP